MQGYWIAAGVSACVAVAAALAERRRDHRANVDQVGWVPWSALMLTALFAGAIFLTLAMRA